MAPLKVSQSHPLSVLYVLYGATISHPHSHAHNIHLTLAVITAIFVLQVHSSLKSRPWHGSYMWPSLSVFFFGCFFFCGWCCGGWQTPVHRDGQQVSVGNSHDTWVRTSHNCLSARPQWQNTLRCISLTTSSNIKSFAQLFCYMPLPSTLYHTFVKWFFSYTSLTLAVNVRSFSLFPTCGRFPISYLHSQYITT